MNNDTNSMTIRRAAERGGANHGWLDTKHTFSFGDYYDPRHMGFRSLRVINEDRVQPGQGFGTHGHRDMEILSYVLEGGLAHKDSGGNQGVIRPGDVQRMTAGTGVMHSEFNASKTEPVHFLQIWLRPDRPNEAPGYEEKQFPAEEKRGQLRLIASKDAANGSVKIHADAKVYVSLLDGAETASRPLAGDRHGWVHVARGALTINGQRLEPGDGASFAPGTKIALSAGEKAEVLVFDLA